MKTKLSNLYEQLISVIVKRFIASYLPTQLVIGLFQKKSKQGVGVGLRIYCFECPFPWNFSFFLLYPWKIPDNTKLNPWIAGYSTKLWQISCNFLGKKQRPLEIPYYFFSVTLGNSTSFLINPWKFHMIFLRCPWKFHILFSRFLLNGTSISLQSMADHTQWNPCLDHFCQITGPWPMEQVVSCRVLN